jgi:hypothetical protein
MTIKLLRRLERWRKENRERYVEQEAQRTEADHLRDRFEDEVVSSRSPSLSRLKRW